MMLKSFTRISSRALPSVARSRSLVVGFVLAGSVGFLCGCGGEASSGGTAKDPASPGKAAEPGAPDIPWAKKNRDQRLEWMGLEVFPKMKEAFQKVDAKEFADFKCQTCHGDNFKEVDFKMPNDLHALPAENTIVAARDYDAETTAFMLETVVPTMAALLGEEPFNPETGQGFGCFRCHTTQ